MASRTKRAAKPSNASTGLYAVSEETKNTERYWIGGRKRDLPVYRIPTAHLYFNIENGRYADRMLLLRAEHKGVEIDPKQDKWKEEIEKMLAGEHRDTARDKDAFKKLREDLAVREQLRPGVALQDGGVLDGNRRLAALRRLWKESRHADKYAYFEAVILPDETTDEERWKIEAGLQLGLNERHDYSPINELIKVRQGLEMYHRKIAHHDLPAHASPYKLVAEAIYGKKEADVREMARRLDLIDEYLAFIGKPQRYDLVGERSEDFLEALRIVRAAENQERSPSLIGKVKAVLFYLVHNDLMNNWQLREIYHALGGDPTKQGRKRQPNEAAVVEFLGGFPEARDVQRQLSGGSAPSATIGRPPKQSGVPLKLVAPGAARSRDKGAKDGGRPAPAQIEKPRAEAVVERFLRTVEAGNKRQPLVRIAAGAKASVEQLVQRIRAPNALKDLSGEDLFALRDAVQAMTSALREAAKALK